MATTNESAVRCAGLTKTYGRGAGGVLALRGVDLDVRPGEVLMLVGPSGCGKTTLISVIAGILEQDEGDCLLFGQDLRRFSKQERTRYRGANIGFVFQSFNLVPALTAAQNVAIPLLIGGMAESEALKRAEASLESVGLGERAGALPSGLSGGQQQRVAIARALAHDPRLVVCDEPTSALDHRTGRQVMETLRGLAVTGGRTLIIVTHDARIFEFADRIARMDDGRIESIEGAP